MEAILDHTSLFSLVFSVISLTSFYHIDATKDGFSVELIHRDSQKSPLYNPSETTYDRVANALSRSYSRFHHLRPTSSSTKEAECPIIANAGEYLMKISIGTPPFDIVAIADKGSDLIWTQCEPCSICYKQDAEFFDRSRSSTYEHLRYDSSQCKHFEGNTCLSNGFCGYSTCYSDDSFSNGDLAVDTLTLPSTTGSLIALPKAVIGCGRQNFGTFDEKSSGIIGLGGGDYSLISQLGDIIAGKFSYCLLPISNTGESTKMKFGSDAIVPGNNGVVSTPLTKQDPSTYYFLILEGVSVGSTRINVEGPDFGSENGNIVVDIGTTLTMVPEEFYSRLKSAVSSQINANRKSYQNLLCYDASTDFTIPDITVHFTNADVKLQRLNTFVLVADGVACFTFAPTEKNFAIYGSMAQMNFLVGYDTQE